ATFNGSGIFADQSLGVPYAVAIQPDGKIVTGGDLTMTFGFTREFCIVRFNTNGTIDKSFGSDGKAIISMAPEAAVSFGRALIIQPDGRIVIGGESNYGFGLARVDTTGSLDTSFDSDGRVRTVFTGGERAFVNALANGPNGTIIA